MGKSAVVGVDSALATIDPRGIRLGGAAAVHVGGRIGRRVQPYCVAILVAIACGRLERHSATAKQYCPSSSTAARHFGTLSSLKPAVLAMQAVQLHPLLRVSQSQWITMMN